MSNSKSGTQKGKINEQAAAAPTSARILLLGDYDVGKSSLILRLTENSFSEEKPVIEDDLKKHVLDVDGIKYEIVLRDTVGKERFRSVSGATYGRADGVMLVYDISNKQSFENVNHWLQEINNFCPTGVEKIVVGNKIDLTENVVIKTAEGKAYADSKQLPFLETSAKQNQNVNEAFVKLTREIKKQMQRTIRRDTQESIVLKEKQSATNQSGSGSGCC